MNQTKAFYDYYIPESCATSSNFDEFICFIYTLGYRTIAINQLIDENSLEPKKKKKKGEPRETNEIVPLPIKAIFDKSKYEDLTILSRLTIVFSNQDVIHKIMKSANIKKYDILSVLPTTQNALQFAVGQMDIDILCFNSETKLPYAMKRKLYNQAVERNIYFEILYAPALLDVTHRKNIIQVAHFYHSIGKSKNIIVSSGAANQMQIRSPYDIINFRGLILGLSPAKAKLAITEGGRNVFVHSLGRRHGKAIMFAEDVSEKDMTIQEDQKSDEEMELDNQPAQKKSKQ